MKKLEITLHLTRGEARYIEDQVEVHGSLSAFARYHLLPIKGWIMATKSTNQRIVRKESING